MESNKGTPSTTARWEYRKVRLPPERPQHHSAEGGLPGPRAEWNRREPLTLTVRYRGGPEAWVEVKARGTTYRFPGSVCLFDALDAVWRASGGPPKA
jgi:hypothetical protein